MSSSASQAHCRPLPSGSARRRSLLLGLVVHKLKDDKAFGSAYTSCVPGRYGLNCEHRCNCASEEVCDEGLSGSGLCRDPTQMDTARRISVQWDTREGASVLASLRMDTAAVSRPEPRQVMNASAVRVLPTPPRGTLRVLASNRDVLSRLGFAEGIEDSAEFAEVFGGRLLLNGSTPYAHCYGGHQFGQWRGQLGDGRSISLGSVAVADGRRGTSTSFEIALKGSGRTPFSRGGDGRAALNNAMREFMGDTALVALGIPAVRSAAVIAAVDDQDRIFRDAWYTGQPEKVASGMLVRVAPSLLRFGSAQLAAKRQGVRGLMAVARLALARLAAMEAEDDESTSYLRGTAASKIPPSAREVCFFGARNNATCAAEVGALGTQETSSELVLGCLLRRVVERTAALVAAWMAAGFAHGVMNTDNLSLLGITIDLNVYGFISRYDRGWSPNHIDDDARYAFGSQSEIAKWNLDRLADALVGKAFLGDDERDAQTWYSAGAAGGDSDMQWLHEATARDALSRFDAVYGTCLDVRMRLRLGLDLGSGVNTNVDFERYKRDGLVRAWLRWIESSNADYHLASRQLANVTLLGKGGTADLHEVAVDIARRAEADDSSVTDLKKWLARYVSRLNTDAGEDDDSTCSASLGNDACTLKRERDRQAQIREHVPLYVLRTEAQAAITHVAAENFHVDALAEAMRLIKQPFAERMDNGQANASDLDSSAIASELRRRLASRDDGDRRLLAAALGRALSSAPTSSGRRQRTSCGAQ